MEAVIFVGIQGAGKSTFYRERFFNTHVRINLDMLHTRNRERILVRACLLARQPFVVDNTNVRAADRAVYIAPAKAAGFRVAAYYFVPDLHASIARNNARAGGEAIPVQGVIATLKRLEAPKPEEGFDAIYEVRVLPENRFEVAAADQRRSE